MNPEPHVEARVTHSFAASPERVFDAFLNPDKVAVWILAGGGEIVRVTVNPQVGGTFSFMVRRGMEVINHIGTYVQMDRPRRLVFTWGVNQHLGDISRVVVDLTPTKTGCLVTLVHEMEPKWADYVPTAQESWAKMLGKIADALS